MCTSKEIFNSSAGFASILARMPSCNTGEDYGVKIAPGHLLRMVAVEYTVVNDIPNHKVRLSLNRKNLYPAWEASSFQPLLDYLDLLWQCNCDLKIFVIVPCQFKTACKHNMTSTTLKNFCFIE